MRWLRVVLILLLGLCGLAIMLASAALLYSLHYIQTPPIDDPTRPLLSWRSPAAQDADVPYVSG